jgi:DNA-binding NtrC family response regulator
VGRDKTLLSEGAQAGPPGRVLLVVGEGHFATRGLEPGASLVIGRDPACELALDHPKVSRRHAIVRVERDGATVEDAGGTNRVKLGGRTLAAGEKVAVPAGAGFQVGPFTVVLLGGASEVGESLDGRAALTVRDVRPSGLTDLLRRVAASDVSVVLRGETGSGKEVMARTLHGASPRRDGPFVAINCAALAEHLLESELFGHERGAFTGATGAKPGLFEVAAGGTVFLDEIGEMPLGMQAKLLRAIETRQVARVGGVKPVDLDVRFLSATHRDLRAAVAAGGFRQDLYFRLDGVTIVIVPLRERRDAIPALVQELLPGGAITPAALAALHRHDWPGNVRELRAVLERARLLAGDRPIDARHLVIESTAAPPPDRPPAPAPIGRAGAGPVGEAAAGGVAGAEPTGAPAARPPIGEPGERDRILRALEQCAGNQTRAARLLGISRATLATRLVLHGIQRPRKP